MNRLIFFLFSLLYSFCSIGIAAEHRAYIKSDTLPKVLSGSYNDTFYHLVRSEAEKRFVQHRLPTKPRQLKVYKENLYKQVIEKASIVFNSDLPLDISYTDSILLEQYTIKNLVFQTRPGVHAVANLFIPAGSGPFPAVIVMAGHAPMGRLYQQYIAVARELALNGYVSLLIDNFGAGERSSSAGGFDYHGGNMGASLMDIGESLLGFQVSDNIRAVDMLCSLPIVDTSRIGATGASGGGNQTMWLAAIDQRIKAAVPVVSVGTFESYVMGDNCICELLIDGLTFTEESGILSLVAPRAIKLCNHQQDKNPAFYPSVMLKSYFNALSVFDNLHAGHKLGYEIFDLPHGYFAEDRVAMLQWFDLHLKGTAKRKLKTITEYDTIPINHLRVFPGKSRPPAFETIASYCLKKGEQLKQNLLANKEDNNANQKRNNLKKILRTNFETTIKSSVIEVEKSGWRKIILTDNNGYLIPILYYPAKTNISKNNLFCSPDGKEGIPTTEILTAKNKGDGIILVDLSGTGECSSDKANNFDKNRGAFHTLARAKLWLGKTILGAWTEQIHLINQFFKNRFKVSITSINAFGEAGLAAIFCQATKGGFSELNLNETPVSYLFDSFKDSPKTASMATHLPGFLNWGDVMLACALTNCKVKFTDPVTISGNRITPNKFDLLLRDYTQFKSKYKQKGSIVIGSDNTPRKLILK